MFGNLYEDDEDDVNRDNGFIGPLQHGAYGSGGKKFKRKPTGERSNYGFVGLLNQGATCYLNSLIQMLYMTPELKKDIYKLGIDDFGITDLQQQQQKEQAAQQKETEDNNSAEPELICNNNNNNTPTSTNTTITNSNSNSSNNYTIENDNDLLNSEYALDILAFGFEDYKVVQGLKRFPTPDQQERLIDWLLNYDESSMFNSNSGGGNGSGNNGGYSLLDETPFGPSVNNNNSNKNNNYDNSMYGDNDASFIDAPLFDNDCYDAYETYPPRSGQPNSNYYNIEGGSCTNNIYKDTPADSSSRAIVLYDETNTINVFTGENKVNETTTTTTNNEASDNIISTTTSTSTTTTSTTSTKKKGRIIPYELQRLFSMLQRGDVYAISTEDLTRSFGWNSDQSVHQQDIHELNRILFDAVEHSIKKTPIESLFNNLYKGYFVNRLSCTKCGTIKDSQEHFQDIPIAVKGFNSIQESLIGSFSTPETLDGRNMYSCEKCNEKVVATFQVVLGKVPPILIFALRRFDYDLQRGVRVKLHNKFEFPQQLDMTPFTLDYLQHKENPTTTDPPQTLNYELFSVLIHSGGAFGGHYHSYIKDIESIGNSTPNKEDSASTTTTTTTESEGSTTTITIDENKESQTKKVEQEQEEEENSNDNKFTGWFDFNDSSVLPIKDNVLKKQFGGKDECAYMLIYREVGLKDKLVSNESGTSTQTAIPLHFEKEIQEFNRNIVNERIEYEKSVNTINLVPRFQDSILVRDGVLYDNHSHLNLNSKEKEKESLSMDVSSTISDLFKSIREKYCMKIDKIESETGSGIIIQEIYVKDGKINLQPPMTPTNLNIKKLGLKEGSQILIWKGEDKSNIPIKFTVKYFYHNNHYYGNGGSGSGNGGNQSPISFDASATEEGEIIVNNNNCPYLIKELQLMINRESNYQQFKQEITNSINKEFIGDHFIESDRLLVYMMPNQTCLLPLEDDVDLKLSDRIYNGIVLQVEVLPEGLTCSTCSSDELDQSTSFVKMDFECNKSKIQIFVKDRFRSNISEPPPIRILSDPKNTIYQLKEIIFNSLYPNQKKDWLDQTVIRKTLVGGYEGTIIKDDTLTLKESGIVDTSLIIFEKGQPTRSTLSIKYHYAIEKKQQFFDARIITVLKSTTIQQLKKNILAQLSISDEIFNRYILRHTDIFEKPLGVIVDEDMTLEEVGLKSMDIVWIEEGMIPARDQIEIKVRWYQINNVDFPILPIPSSPILHLNPTYIPTVPDLFKITTIGDLWVDKKSTLAQLKNQFLNWSPLLEQCKIDKETQDIRIWLDEKLLTTMNKQLSKLHIQLDSVITIELYNKPIIGNGCSSIDNVVDIIIDDNDNNTTMEEKEHLLNGASSNNNQQHQQHSSKPVPPVLLYTHRRRPQEQSFEYPAKQISFTGSTIIELTNEISKQFEIDQQYLLLYKYFPNNKSNPWRVIEEKPITTQPVIITSDNIAPSKESLNELLSLDNSINLRPKDIDLASTTSDDTTFSTNTTSTVSTTTTTEEIIEIIDDQIGSVPPPPPPPSKNKEVVPTIITELRGKPYLLKDGDIIAYLDTRDDPENNDKFALSMPKSSNYGGSRSTFYSGSGDSGFSSNKYRHQEVDLKIELDDFE